MTEKSTEPASPTIKSTKQDDQLSPEEVDRLQCEANEDSTGSEDLRLFLKELHEKVREDHQQQQQQQQQQQSQTYNPVPPSTGNLPPGYIAGPGELSIDATSHYSSQCNNLRETEAGLVQHRGNHVVQYQTTAPGTVIDQNYHTSVPEISAQDVVPDGGWGWIVVLGSFCCMVLVDGVCFTYGLLLNPVCPYSSLRAFSPGWKSNETGPIKYPRSDRITHPVTGSCIPISELGEDFQIQQRAILLTPGALIVGLYLFLGPIVSALSNQFDFRPVAMIGAIISTIALFSSAFVTSIEQFILTFGLLGGIGLSFIYLPAIATVGHWFQQKRPLAVGLALCGSGMGCLIGGQAIPRLIVLFTWRGTLIILSAVCFQCLTLILLFRPWDIHFQITQAQKAKRLAREAARRTAALRRAEAERLLLEARRRKYLASVEAAATAQAIGMKKHSLVNPVLLNNNNKAGFHQTTEYRLDPSAGGGGMINSRRNSNQTGRMHLQINQTRNGRQHKHFLFHQNNRTPLSVGMVNSRPNALTGNRSVNQNSGSSRMTNRKRAPSRRVIVYRGSIMQRIIEEKRRQRTISVGSLDGMVITRDNELIAASKVMNYDKPLLDPTTVQRISETVARKIEAKLSSTVAPNLSNINEGAANGGVVVTSGGNSTIGSRTGLRVSLPQIVQEYIQSQLSLTLQQQQSAQPKLSSSISPLTNNSYQFTPTDQGIYPSMLPASKLSTANVSVHEFTVQPTSAVCDGSVTNLDGTVLSTTEHFFPADNVPVNQSNIPTSGSIMTVNFPAYLSGNATNAPVNFVPGILATTTTTPTVLGSGLSRRHPNHSVSENVSLRRTTSDASLESRFTSITGVDPSYAGIDILDDEIKADIQMLVRKEISRPQYKKDFFYTGSIRQMDPAKMAINHKLSINLPIVSNVERPNRSTASFRLPAGHFQSDIRPEHCSQTSLGVVNQFIPPAPCPPIPINQQPIVYSNPPIVGLSQFAVPSDNSMNQCSTNVYSDTVDSFLSQNNTEILDNLKSKTFNQSGDCEKVDYTRTSVNTNIQQQQPEEPLDYVVDGDVDDDVDMGIEDVEQDDDDDNDDDENNDGDLIDGQINDEDGLYTRCPKCFNRCNTCGNVLFCFSSCSPLETFMQDLLSPKLLSSLTFLFFLLSSMTAMLGLVIPFLMLPDLLAEMNMKLEDSGFIISSIGAGNTFGRLFATFYIEKAWSTTYKWADSLWMNNISLLLTALTVFALPVVTRYYAALVLVSCGFGLFSAVFVSLKSILVVELIGIDRLTNAFGYLLLFQGCAAIIGPPVAGYLRDARIDSLPAFNIFTAHTAPMHNASAIGFLFSGTALLVSCLLGCPLRWLSKREFSSLVANTNEYIPNHMDHTDYGYELNRTSPVILTTGGQDYVQLTNSNEYHLGGELMNSGKTEPGSGRRMDIVDHYVANPSTPSVTQMTVIDALRSQANSQLSPSAPPPSINCLPISGHVIFSTAPPPVASTLSGVVVGPAGTAATATGPLDNITVGTANVTVPVADDSVPMVTVGGLKLSAAVIPVSVVGGAGSVPNTGSLSLPPQTVEVLEVKEDPGLEPVVEEEEEEDYEDDTFDDGAIDQYTKDNNISLHHLDSVTTTMLVNNDSSIPTSESSFNQDTSDSTPMNDSSTSSSSTTAATHNTNSRKDNAKYKRRRTSKLSPPVVSSTVLDDKLNNEVGNDTTTDVTITSTTTTVTTVTSSDHGDNNTEEDDNNHPNVDKKNDDDHDDKDVHMS